MKGMMILLLTCCAAAAAMVGGYVAIRSRERIHVAIAITTGLVLGVVAFDLLPEIFQAVTANHVDVVWPMLLLVIGFLFFHAVEKLILVHEGSEDEYGPHHHPRLGVARAIALAGHSLLDGVSIGVSFHIDPTIGYAVALAVIAHRFADGFDTASFMVLHHNKLGHIKRLLGFVVIMPILGGVLSLAVPFSETVLVLYLGFFAGILLYIASSNISPQAHAQRGSYGTLGLTVLGAAFMLALSRVV